MVIFHSYVSLPEGNKPERNLFLGRFPCEHLYLGEVAVTPLINANHPDLMEKCGGRLFRSGW
jgi:hypothetical protein